MCTGDAEKYAWMCNRAMTFASGEMVCTWRSVSPIYEQVSQVEEGF